MNIDFLIAIYQHHTDRFAQMCQQQNQSDHWFQSIQIVHNKNDIGIKAQAQTDRWIDRDGKRRWDM